MMTTTPGVTITVIVVVVVVRTLPVHSIASPRPQPLTRCDQNLPSCVRCVDFPQAVDPDVQLSHHAQLVAVPFHLVLYKRDAEPGQQRRVALAARPALPVTSAPRLKVPWIEPERSAWPQAKPLTCHSRVGQLDVAYEVVHFPA
uniref:Secreted protein n=2 Tax=Lygus hesperus TaxID=30085 RepID=A0A0A9YRS6_LYGHE